ncbi:hypothetical protein DFAR_2870027 [Desulfarculales bacterium]
MQLGRDLKPKEGGCIDDEDGLLFAVLGDLQDLFSDELSEDDPGEAGVSTSNRCGSVRLWGHGFVPAYFDEAPIAIWLRRCLCPACRAVIRLRLRGYWSRFQASVEIIRQSLPNKLARGRWNPSRPRSRQRH